MAGEVIVDALPYIDHGYDDIGVRESALAMVEEECRRYRPTKNYLDHLPLPTTNAFETKLMIHEFERIQNRQPMETLSMKRYELPPPPAGKLSEVSAWQESIENSMAQLEHQWVRAMNLELMLEFGIESWKAHLEVFAALQAKGQTLLQKLKREIQDVNWQRKQAQTNAGEKLKTLEATWVMLVSKNYEIEQQCVELDRQLFSIRLRLNRLEQESSKQRLQQVQVVTHGVHGKATGVDMEDIEDKECEEDTEDIEDQEVTENREDIANNEVFEDNEDMMANSSTEQS